jgi:amino acid transporter
VIRSIVTIRAIIPFFVQVLAAIVLRVREPRRPRPFRMWLYPLPAAVAMVLWGYIVVSPEKGFKPEGAAVMAAGLVFFLARAFARKQWPFARRVPA